MNKKLRKSVCLSMVMVLFITLIPLMKPIQAHAVDYSAWSSIFDPTYYANHYKDAKDYANGNVDLLWQHFVQIGIPNARQACAEFNVSIYIQNYPELQQMYGSNLMQYYIHYAQTGKAEGRNAKCLNSTMGKIGTTVPDSFKAGYKYGDYQIYNMHAYENGLKGDYIWFEGVITGFQRVDYTDKNGNQSYGYFAWVTSSDGNRWGANVYLPELGSANVSNIAGLLNHKVCIAAYYEGYSDVYSVVLPHAIKIYDEQTGNIIPTSFASYDSAYYATLSQTTAQTPTNKSSATSNQPKQTTSSASGYESIYNTYSAKLNSYSGTDINSLAAIYDEGVSKMADYYWKHGGSYSTYESWATKLYSVYEKKGMSMYGF